MFQALVTMLKKFLTRTGVTVAFEAGITTTAPTPPTGGPSSTVPTGLQNKRKKGAKELEVVAGTGETEPGPSKGESRTPH